MQCNMLSPNAWAPAAVCRASDMRAVVALSTTKTTTITG